MTYEEYIHTNMQNEIVWICDYRFVNDMVSKPRRHIKPTKVMCDGNCNTSKRILYSNYHFKEVKDNGEPIKNKVIAPYDGTGYRSYPGVSLQIFITEEECKEYYKKVVEKLIQDCINEKNKVLESYDMKIQKLYEELKEIK